MYRVSMAALAHLSAHEDRPALFPDPCHFPQSQESVKDDRCGTAPSQPCKERQLRFLYFADVSSVGSQVRCLKATQATLVGRRCLVGPNRYESLEECRAACVRGGDEGVGQR
ncbi:hypothetical protein MRX96_003214 [Rhipicephalus microplus]